MSHFGIPDPGRAPRLEQQLSPRSDGSPFDAGCVPCPQGGEDRWSARWLMGQMGYPTWQHFEPVIERAKQAAHNEGFNVHTLFTVNREKTGGRPQTDYRRQVRGRGRQVRPGKCRAALPHPGTRG